MNVRELKDLLENVQDDLEVVIDHESDIGWYRLEEVVIVKEGKLSFLNLKSDNEGY